MNEYKVVQVLFVNITNHFYATNVISRSGIQPILSRRGIKGCDSV